MFYREKNIWKNKVHALKNLVVKIAWRLIDWLIDWSLFVHIT